MATLTEQLFDDGFSGPIDPFALFEDWFAAAQKSELNDPNAMALSTVDADGLPDSRMVLLNLRDARGFCFFTNLGSAKGTQLLAHPKAALLFHWKSLRRQVRMRGPVEPVTAAEADAYFARRPRGSQVGAHASAQSRLIASKAALKQRWEKLGATLPDPVPRPDYWSGFRLLPEVMEFWQDGAFRLHDRMQFRRDSEGWTRQRLNP